MEDTPKNITDLTAYREAQQPHTSGPCVCLGCRHEWVAVCPVGTTDMECPSCHLNKGTHKNLVMPEGAYWQCNCGTNLFFISDKLNAICPTCGNYQRIESE